MAESGLASETRMLSRSLEQMCVSTPVGKESSNHNDGFKNKITLPLSPPQTLDIKQKRQRSQSLMMSQSNDTIATKRRLRSRSRLGLGPEDVPSAFMSPPTTKPREQTQSRSHKQNEIKCHPEVFSKHLTVDVEGTLNSVYMTPTSERREPLQNKDINTVDSGISCSFDKKGWLTTESCSSDEGDTVRDEDDKTRVKLDFDHYATVPDSHVNPSPVTPDHNRTIGRRMGEEKVDIITELALMNCEEICKQILCHLQPHDLLRVASVSKLWRKICKKDRIASPRLDQFISGQKQHVMRKGKENLGHHTKFNHSVPQRPPFSVKDHNTVWTPQAKQTAAIDAVKTNIMSAFDRIKCPWCGSPSRKTTNGLCQCDKCKELLCTLCHQKVDKSHKIGKCTIKIKSKNPKGREVVGSKRSKDRLKRY